MNRQKALLAIIVSLVGVSVVVHGVRSFVIEPYRQLKRDAARKDRQVAEYRAMIGLRVPYMEKWLGLGSRTLAGDPNEAQVRFDEEIKRLIKKHGLQRESTRPKAHKRRKNGVTLVPYSVQAEGSLKKIVGFLVSLYELPYTARVTTLRLRPVSSKDRRTLVMSLDTETMVLPESEMGGPVQPVNLKAEDLPKNKRYELETGEAYALIYEGRFFEEYVKPKPPPPPPERKKVTKRPEKKRTVKPPPPPPKPTPRDNSVIVALLGWGGHAEVVTERPGKRSERKRYAPGDEMAGGILRTVQPLGAVIRIEGVDWVYPMGAALDKEEQRVRASEVPRIRRILETSEPAAPAPETQAASAPSTDAEEPESAQGDDKSVSGDESEGAGQSPDANAKEEKESPDDPSAQQDTESDGA